MLDTLLALLDAPRAAVWGGINAGYHALGGNPDNDLHGAADALAAAGMDPDSFLTKALGFAGDVATDPLTYAGAALGKGLAGKVFKATGPLHGSDAQKLAGLAIPAEAADRGGVGMIARALGGPQASQVLHEIPAGSVFQGAGAESLALRTPAGDVLQLRHHNPAAAINYPVAESLNTPTRRVFHGNIEVTRSPLATRVGDPELFEQASPTIADNLRQAGMDIFDLKPEDVGMVGGKPKLLDMGSIDVPGGRPAAAIAGPTPGHFAYPGMAAGAGASALLRSLQGG